MTSDHANVEFHIRPARMRDVDVLARMARDYVEVGLEFWQWHPRRLRASLRDRETCGIVSWIGRTVAGFALMQFLDEQAHLNLLAVRPEFRRHGIGRALVEWLEQSALTAGIGEVTLEVREDNVSAQRFYNALGYIPTRTLPGYYCGRIAAIRMWRNLNPYLSLLPGSSGGSGNSR